MSWCFLALLNFTLLSSIKSNIQCVSFHLQYHSLARCGVLCIMEHGDFPLHSLDGFNVPPNISNIKYCESIFLSYYKS